jgi:hypothetical protein
MEVTLSSETSVHIRPTPSCIPEDSNIHNYRYQGLMPTVAIRYKITGLQVHFKTVLSVSQHYYISHISVFLRNVDQICFTFKLYFKT